MNKEGIVSQLFSINKMWSATILLWIYRIGLVLIPLCEFIASFAGGILAVIATIILFIPLTILLWRISIEFSFVVFGIYDKLSSIDSNIKNKISESK